MADRDSGTDDLGQSVKAAVREIVATWPPLSAETRAELAILLLSPAGGDHAAT
jgi:hypothetical protein